MPRIIHVLAFDNAQVLDVTGPLQVFASANDLARQRAGVKRDEMLRMDGYNPDQHKFDPMLPYHMQPKY